MAHPLIAGHPAHVESASRLSTNAMDSDRITLRNGETLAIARHVPPMDTFDGRVRTWAQISDELFSGELANTLHTPYFVGTIDGEYAGSLGYYVPTDTRDVGVVEFVATEDHHRRKGVADALMARMIAEFQADGGQALFLCTTNPIAGRLYENHGFWYRIGDGMRYTAPHMDDFDTSYFAADGEPLIRDAVWGDLPRAAALYNAREPRWLLKDVLTNCLRDTRYEQHFVRLMVRIDDDQGAALVLATRKNRMAGLVAFARNDTFRQQHVATLSLRVAPAYMDHATDLVQAAFERAQKIGVSALEFPVAASDDDLAQIAIDAGFAEAARLPNRVRDDDALVDVRLFEAWLGMPSEPFHAPETYYGDRQTWQIDRIEAGGSEDQPAP